MTREKVLQGSATNKSFWKGFEILSSLRNGWQKIWKSGKQILEKLKRKRTGETAKTLHPEVDVSLWKLGARFEDPSDWVDLSDKPMTRKIRIRSMNTNQSFLTDYEDPRLIPELVNEIVLHEIIPKLPWKDFHVLSLVNRDWQRAVHSHLLYGDELFQDDEQVYHPAYLLGGIGAREAYSSLFSKVEEKLVWTLLNPYRREYLKRLFSSQGGCHTMICITPHIEMYFGRLKKGKFCGPYCSQDVCTDVHSFLFAAIGGSEQAEFFLYATRMINADLFVVVGVYFYIRISEPGKYQICVLRSEGFGSEREKITWEKIGPSVASYSMLEGSKSF